MNKCNQCKLEGNTGVCDRKECVNNLTPNNSTEEEFKKEFGEIAVEVENRESYNGVGYKDITEEILAFIQERESLAYQKGKIETLKDMRLFFAKADWHGTGKAMVEDYAKQHNINLSPNQLK